MMNVVASHLRRRERGRGPRGRAVLVAALVTLVAACGEEASPPGPVLLIGDSLFFHAAGELRQDLEADGWAVETLAYPGAGLGGGGFAEIDWTTELDRVLGDLEPQLAVVELGTNGCEESCPSVPEAIEAIMERLDDVPTVLWLNVRTDAPRPDDAADINDALRRAADRHANLDLLPYDAWLEDRPGLVQEDGVHLTEEGQHAVADRVRHAVRDHADVDG